VTIQDDALEKRRSLAMTVDGSDMMNGLVFVPDDDLCAWSGSQA